MRTLAKVAFIVVALLGSSLGNCPSNFPDQNCLKCSNDPNPVCEQCMFHWELNKIDKTCQKACSVSNCDDCKEGDSNICSKCKQDFGLITKGGYVRNFEGKTMWQNEISECQPKPLGTRTTVLVFIIMILLCAVLCLGLLCWRFVHKRKFIQQKTYQSRHLNTTINDEEDFNSDEANDYRNSIRVLTQNYAPPYVMPPANPVPHFQNFDQGMPPPPPGNSLLQEHMRQQTF